jgi:hypothetical protein
MPSGDVEPCAEPLTESAATEIMVCAPPSSTFSVDVDPTDALPWRRVQRLLICRR